MYQPRFEDTVPAAEHRWKGFPSNMPRARRMRRLQLAMWWGFRTSREVARLLHGLRRRRAQRGELCGVSRARAGRGLCPRGGQPSRHLLGCPLPRGVLVGANVCWWVSADAWLVWAPCRHDRRSSAGVFSHPGSMAGAAVGAPPVVVRLVETIESVAPGVDLNLGITDQGAYVVGIRNVVQCALMNAKAQANRFLAKPENKDLAQTLDIAGSIPTARWPDATLAQPTCGVQYIKKVLDWAAERHGGVQVLSVDERSALVNTVRARLLPHAGQLLRKLRLQSQQRRNRPHPSAKHHGRHYPPSTKHD